MPRSYSFEKSFEKLSCSPPDTKAAQVRTILPQIDKARKEGKSIKQIWRQLSEDGLEMSYRAFHLCIHRAGRSITAKPAELAKPPEIPARLSLTSPSSPNSEDEALDPRDPMFNVLNAERNRRGFFYPGTQSADELVHGRKKR